MKMPILKTRNNLIKSIVWGIVILLACTLPVNRVSRVSLFGVRHIDKIFHFLMYFVFSFILYFDLYKSVNTLRNRYFVFLIIFLTALMWGIIIELIQFYALSSREGSIADVFANFSGTITGILVIFFAGKYLFKN